MTTAMPAELSLEIKNLKLPHFVSVSQLFLNLELPKIRLAQNTEKVHLTN